MNGAPFFVRPCPSCGRSTQIRVDLLGRDVCCQHCRREFVASDPECESAALDDPVQYWINYTEHEFTPDERYSANNPR